MCLHVRVSGREEGVLWADIFEEALSDMFILCHTCHNIVSLLSFFSHYNSIKLKLPFKSVDSWSSFHESLLPQISAPIQSFTAGVLNVGYIFLSDHPSSLPCGVLTLLRFCFSRSRSGSPNRSPAAADAWAMKTIRHTHTCTHTLKHSAFTALQQLFFFCTCMSGLCCWNWIFSPGLQLLCRLRLLSL